MGFGGLRKRIRLLDTELQIPGLVPSKKVVRTGKQFFTVRTIAEHGWPCQKQGFRPQRAHAERFDRTAGLTVRDHIAPWAQTIHTSLKCRCSDRVVYDVNTRTIGEPLNFSLEILFGIKDHFVSTRFSCQRCFCFG